MSDGACPECGHVHNDWSKDGEHAVAGPYHSGLIVRWECGICGGIREVGRR